MGLKYNQNFKIMEINDVGRIITGKTPPTKNPEYYGSLMPFLTPSDIKTRKYVENTERSLSTEGIKLLTSNILLPNSIAVTCIGSIGKIVYIKKNTITNQQINSVIPNKLIDPEFLYYFFKNNEKLLKNLASGGSVVPILKKSLFSKIQINVFTIQSQRKIGKILSDLDNKIENLHNQNTILNQIVQSIFKSWFVDFDGMTEFKDSELGKIPKGWKIEKIKNVIKIFDKQRIPLSTMERMNRKGKYPYYGATSIIDYIDDYIFDGIFLLIGEDGSVIDENNLPFVQYVNGKIWVNNHTHIIQGKNEITTEFLTLFFKRLNIDPWITGTTQLKINQTNLLSIPIIIPDKISLKRFDRIAHPIFTHIIKNDMMNLSLTKIRDILLPKLLSGELKV